MACALALDAGAFQRLVKIWRIAYDGIEGLLWHVVLQCYVVEGYAVVPWRVAEIGCGIDDCILVYLDGGESGFGESLCHHECEYACARAYVQDAATAVCHCSEQVAVGTYLHAGVCLVDAELAETKTFTMYHGRCTMYDVRWTMYGLWFGL